MAKKENLSSVKTDLDNNFDDFNFDFDAPPAKDNRSPVTKLATGALAGAASASKQEAFIRQTIKSVLPDGYGLALDLQQEVDRKSKELYNNAVKEVKPIIGSLSSSLDKLLPSGSKQLKSKLEEINKWSQDQSRRYSRNDKEDSEKASIAASIGETFKFQMQQDARQSAKDDGKDKLQEGLALARHRDTFGLLNQINVGITTLTAYQNRVTAAYQKKSLELQYRSLFTSIDILQESKRQNAFTSEALASITKNTGLPDFVKLTEGDRLEGVLRNKLAKTIGASLLGGKDNPVSIFSDHISKVFNDKLKDMTGILASSADMLAMVASGKDEMQGQDKYNVAGKYAGEQAAGYIRGKVSPYAKKYLPKKVIENGPRLEGYIKNAAQYSEKFKSGSYGEKDGAVKALVFKTLKEFIPSFGLKGSLEKDSASSLNEAHVYTKQTHKSINEVIPGYLSRIFRELQVMRTGDTSIGLTSYDTQSNKFVDSKAVSKNLLNSMIDKQSVESTKSQLSDLIKMVDPEGKLKPEAAQALARKTLKDNLSGKLGIADRTAHEFTYQDDKQTQPYAKEIAEAMQKYFGSNKNGKLNGSEESYTRQNAFTEKQRNLGRYINDARGQIQNSINLGNYQELEDLGLIKFVGGQAEVDFEKITDYALGEKYSPKSGSLAENSQKGQSPNRASARVQAFKANFDGESQTKQSFNQPQQSSNAELLRAIGEASGNPQLQQAVTTLDVIKDVLLESNVAQEAYFASLIESVRSSATIESTTNSSGVAQGRDNPKILKNPSINLRGFLGKTTKKIGSLFSLGNKIGVMGLKTGAAALGLGLSAGKKALGFMSDMVAKAGQSKEVFVAGEETPRISSKLLKAGKYFDKKGKVYKNLDAIDDTVYAEDGSVVITREELKDAYIRTSQKSGVLTIAKFGIGLVSSAFRVGTGIIPPIFRLALDSVKLGLRTVKNLLDQPEDIYIKQSDVPVMLKRTMAAGGYFLKSDMSVVSKPSQITGTVVNAEGDVVLTEADLRSGIFDKNGKKIKSPLDKIFSFAKSTIGLGIKLGVSAVKYAAKSGSRLVGAGLKLAGKSLALGSKFLGGGLSAFGGNAQALGESGVADGGQTLNVLEKILFVLDTRLPSKANRKGSWKNAEKRSSKRSTRAADNEDAASKGGLGDGDGSKKETLFDKLKERFKGDSPTDSSAKGPAGEPKKGLLGKAKGMLGGKAGAILGTAGMLGAGAASAGSLPGSVGSAISGAVDVAEIASTVYNIAKFVLPAAEVAGATLATGAVTTGASVVAAEVAGAAAVSAGVAGTGIGSTVLAGLGGLAASLGAIVSSPVVIGALALAAVGVGVYVGYQYFSKTDYLKNLRYIQYGFSQKNLTGNDRLGFLEQELKDATYFKEGVAAIEPKKFDLKKVLGLFGINQDDEKAVSKWTYWFQERFKPVYLTHVTALRGIDNKAYLSDVDSLKVEQKSKFLESARFQEGPYHVNINPVAGFTFSLTTAKDVNASYQEARKGIDDQKKDSKDSDTGKLSEPGVKYDSMGNVVSSAAAQSLSANASETKPDGKDYSKENLLTKPAQGMALSIAGASGQLPAANMLDTLEGIRMRSYGLTVMESDKVSALRKLENLIIAKVQYGGDNKAIYKADSLDTIVAGGMFFGVTTGTELADAWSKWFQTRFLPVYLSYLGLIKQNTGTALKANTTPSLSALQALSIGTQISSIDSAWSVKTSPWNSYKLGIDQSVVKELIEVLRLSSKQDIMPEASVVKAEKSTLTAPADDQAAAIKSALQSKSVSQPTAFLGGQDAESVETNRAPVGSAESLNGVAGLLMAEGPLSDGRNASAFLKIAEGATLSGINPEFLKNFNGLVDEYGTLTGQSTLLNSGFRSFDKQAALYKSDPSKAAPPGSSLHEFGLAVDVQSKILDDMDKRGLLRKYGFTRPVGGEPWHLEATGIQNDINGFKRDPAMASKAIAAGVGKGGGGYGTMADSSKYRRSPAIAKQILDANIPASKAQAQTLAIPDKAQIAGTVQTPVVQASAPTYDAMGNVTGFADAESAGKVATSSAYKTKSEILGSSANTKGVSNSGAVATSESSKSSIYGSSGKTATGNMLGVLQATTPSTGGNYATIPSPTGGSGWSSNKDMIIAAAKAVGIDPKYMAAIGAVESGFNPSAKASTGTASGMNQFIDDTWKEQMRKNASRFGIPANASVLDPKANALLGAAYTKENISALSGIKTDITGTDVYMAHFLGAAGAKKFFSADPSMVGAQVLPEAAGKNQSIFYDNNRPRTIGEIYALLNSRTQTKMQQFGVDASYIPSTTSLVAKNTSTTGLEVRTASIGLGASASNGGGFTPTAQSTGPFAVKPPSVQMPSTVASMVSPMTDIGGFNMQGMQQSIQNPKQDMNTAMGNVSATLTQSLDIQTKMLGVLQAIAGMSGFGAPAQPQQPVQQSQQKIQTTDQGGKRSEGQQFSEQALRSFNVNAERLSVPVPMSRI